MKNIQRNDRITLVVVLLIVFLLVILATRTPGHRGNRLEWSGERVGIVEVTGVIWDSRDWVEKIDKFRRDDRIAAIVVRLESPGGGIAASQELYEAIARAGEAKPVVASMGGVAASGAYYAALGADSIVANPGTTTGSIGVMIEFTQFQELFGKLGISNEVVKSGPFKDSGNPARELSDSERRVFQGYIDDAFAQFTAAVVEERGLSEREVAKAADGRVYTGRQALELGLVDRLGDLHSAILLAGEMAGLKGEPAVEYPPRSRDYWWVSELLDEVSIQTLKHLEGRPAFQYLWRVETAP